jgi:cardiolipin synthase
MSLGVTLFTVTLAACVAALGLHTHASADEKAVAPTAAGPTVAASAPPAGASSTSEYQLVQEPQAGFTGLYAQTAAAKSSIDMEMYELSDTTEEAALVAARARGVQVRVLLDSVFNGRRTNMAAFDYLTGHGVAVKWATGVIFHIKTTTFDGTMSDVSTGNLTPQYYSSTWDATVIDHDPGQVAAIEGTFGNDWAGTTPRDGTVAAPGLVWSPDAETALVSEISLAKQEVDFTSEELADPAIYDALAQDARRGVTCNVLMTADSDWNPAFTTITAAGCHVHVLRDSTKVLYVHEKQILIDPTTQAGSVLIGSQNASKTSLTRNRELSIRLTRGEAPVIESSLVGTFQAVFQLAPSWTPGS